MFQIDTIRNTEGGWARFVMYAQEVPFGAGFTRFGAAEGAFGKANAADPYFGRGYFFVDHLFVVALVEIGLPGVIILSLILVRVGLHHQHLSVPPGFLERTMGLNARHVVRLFMYGNPRKLARLCRQLTPSGRKPQTSFCAYQN